MANPAKNAPCAATSASTPDSVERTDPAESFSCWVDDANGSAQTAHQLIVMVHHILLSHTEEKFVSAGLYETVASIVGMASSALEILQEQLGEYEAYQREKLFPRNRPN